MSSLLWARHIIVRFRDALVRTPRRQVATDQVIPPMILSLIRGVGLISVLLFLVRKRKCSLRAHLLLFTAARNKTLKKNSYVATMVYTQNKNGGQPQWR
jgi:hypothetical protein